jgi:hypothetical protein
MSLEELNQKLKEQNLIGYWTIPNTSTGFREPEANFRQFLWKRKEIRAASSEGSRLSVEILRLRLRMTPKFANCVLNLQAK